MEDCEKTVKHKLGKKLTFLAVDDDRVFLNLLSYNLKKLYPSSEVHLFETSADTLDFYKNHFNDIDIVIVDMMLPDMNGLVLSQKIEKINKNERIILISAYSLEFMITQKGAGAVEFFLPKNQMDPTLNKFPIMLDYYIQKILSIKEIQKKRRKAESKLGKSEERYRILNKELNDFIYTISHDLKEPLFAIEGYSTRLAKIDHDEFDEKGKMYTKRIKINTEIMSRRISEIMEVMRIGMVEYDFKNINVGDIIKDVVNRLESKIEAGKINVCIQDNLPNVLCDKERMKDVFTNLLTNAIKFMGDGKQREIKIGSDIEGDLYNIFVEDTGIGIKKENQNHIFKIFNKLNNEIEGDGVGLAIVKKIVELHKGKLMVKSPVKKERGSRFYFTIPISKI